MNSENPTTNDDARLDRFFERYRESCPEPDPSIGFMPAVWQKIEGRQNFWYVFQRFGKTVTTASAAVCLLLLVLNLITSPAVSPFASTYADALMAEHTAEKTYYAEAIRNTVAGDETGSQPAH